MTKILKFVYDMIIYLFIPMVIINGIYMCENDKDCRKFRCDPFEVARCIGIMCQCVES
ncbi:unnamed protein product [Trifolium pratense]|uniref:Uncharacterized protein n=1 Tax=Trifolium pratense TaxID=57577 RepID=A0ACB0L9W5_TRIPR|nr:unnamed protein product [Trifolium pratense]